MKMVAIYTPTGEIVEGTTVDSRKKARKTASQRYGCKWRDLWLHGFRVHSIDKAES